MSRVTYDSDEVREMKEDLPEWMVKAIEELYNHVGIGEDFGAEDGESVTVQDISETYFIRQGSAYQVELNQEEYDVFQDIEVAEQGAIEYLEELIGMEPEMFDPDFLRHYMEVMPADARMIAIDEADAIIGDLDDDEVVDRAKDFVEQIYSNRELRGLIRDYELYIDEMEEEGEENGEAEELLNEIRELYEYVYREYVENRLLDDPVDYFVHELGAYTEEELFEQPFIRIDARDAARAAVLSDGIAHFLAPYDMETVELGGPVAFRIN